MAVFTEQTISFLISLLLVSVQGKAISRFLMFQLLTRFTEIASPPLPIAPYSYSPGVIPVAVIASPPIFALVTQPVVLVSRVERDSFYLSHRPTVPQLRPAPQLVVVVVCSTCFHCLSFVYFQRCMYPTMLSLSDAMSHRVPARCDRVP